MIRKPPYTCIFKQGSRNEKSENEPSGLNRDFWRVLLEWIKMQERETDHSVQHNSEVYYSWSPTYTVNTLILGGA
jgi:hypothetical protein